MKFYLVCQIFFSKYTGSVVSSDIFEFISITNENLLVKKDCHASTVLKI